MQLMKLISRKYKIMVRPKMFAYHITEAGIAMQNIKLPLSSRLNRWFEHQMNRSTRINNIVFISLWHAKR
jgi:hypothetical protein